MALTGPATSSLSAIAALVEEYVSSFPSVPHPSGRTYPEVWLEDWRAVRESNRTDAVRDFIENVVLLQVPDEEVGRACERFRAAGVKVMVGEPRPRRVGEC